MSHRAVLVVCKVSLTLAAVDDQGRNIMPNRDDVGLGLDNVKMLDTRRARFVRHELRFIIVDTIKTTCRL